MKLCLVKKSKKNKLWIKIFMKKWNPTQNKRFNEIIEKLTTQDVNHLFIVFILENFSSFT